MKATQKYFLLALLAGAVLAGCRDDDDAPECPCDDPSNPECPNYDPCLEENPVRAAFRIYDEIFQSGPNAGTWFEDEVIWNGRVKFSALEQGAYYKWYLGQEVVQGYSDSSVIRNILHLDPGIYTASLVVEKEPNNTCFPEDSGRDSTFRTFEIKNVCDLLIMNRFKGVYAHNPNDSLIIEFFPAIPGSGSEGWEYDCENFFALVGVNLRENNDTLGFTSSGGVATAILNKKWVHSNTGDLSPVGYFEVFPDNSCRGEYKIINQDYSFTGKLIQ